MGNFLGEGKYAKEMAGECSGVVTVPWVNVGRNVRLCMKDYKSLRASVMICATLVNTQTHTDSC